MRLFDHARFACAVQIDLSLNSNDFVVLVFYKEEELWAFLGQAGLGKSARPALAALSVDSLDSLEALCLEKQGAVAKLKGAGLEEGATKALIEAVKLRAMEAKLQGPSVKLGTRAEAIGDAVSKKKPAKIELSEEEKAMNGAPEGELFQVTVFSRAELNTGTAIDASTELSTVVVPALTANEEAWNVMFDALTSLRRILVYHPEVVTSATIEGLVPGIEKSIRSLRSVLAKNAIFCSAG